jgi:23S rRNA (cytidine2498-2'-O)-methyltransferase
LPSNLPAEFDLLIPFLRFDQELEKELLLSDTEILFKNQFFFIVPRQTVKPVWAQDWWPASRLHSFKAKSEAIKLLRGQKNLGAHLPSDIIPAFAESLKKELRELKLKRITYEVPHHFDFKFFTWTLFNSESLIICEEPFSRFPLGWHEFAEDKDYPPNRAYLKIWELLCLGHITLSKDDVAIDLGSSPGGWSWALSRFVKTVYSVDRAPLDPKIAAVSNISFSTGDAFAVEPSGFADCNWLFSDIICTPAKLLTLVGNWRANSNVKNFVCTIKFKGDCDFDMMRTFLEIPGSRIIHLYQNKNEVTWILQRQAK